MPARTAYYFRHLVAAYMTMDTGSFEDANDAFEGAVSFEAYLSDQGRVDLIDDARATADRLLAA